MKFETDPVPDGQGETEEWDRPLQTGRGQFFVLFLKYRILLRNCLKQGKKKKKLVKKDQVEGHLGGSVG